MAAVGGTWLAGSTTTESDVGVRADFGNLHRVCLPAQTEVNETHP